VRDERKYLHETVEGFSSSPDEVGLEHFIGLMPLGVVVDADVGVDRGGLLIGLVRLGGVSIGVGFISIRFCLVESILGVVGEELLDGLDIFFAFGDPGLSIVLDEFVDVVLEDVLSLLLSDGQESLLIEFLNLLTDHVVLGPGVELKAGSSLAVVEEVGEDDALSFLLQHLHLLLLLAHFLDELSKHLLFLVHRQLNEPILRLRLDVAVGVVPFPGEHHAHLPEQLPHQVLRLLHRQVLKLLQFFEVLLLLAGILDDLLVGQVVRPVKVGGDVGVSVHGATLHAVILAHAILNSRIKTSREELRMTCLGVASSNGL
jgi:hypothetical protein